MKNQFVIIISIFSFLLSSCGTFQSEIIRNPAGGESCLDMVSDILKLKNAKKISIDTNDLESPGKALKAQVELDLTAEQLDDFFKIYGESDFSAEEMKTIRAIFLYAGDEADVRRKLFKNFRNKLMGMEINVPDKIWEKFEGHRENADVRTKKMLAKDSSEDGKKMAYKFEKLYYTCKAQVKSNTGLSAESVAQAKRLTYALTAGAGSATLVTYSVANWDHEKNEKWYKELAFMTAMTIVFNYLGGKYILANQKLNPWKEKMPLNFLNKAVGDIGISAFYGYMFNVSASEANRKLEELEKDPEAMAKLEELLQVAKDNGLLEKHVAEAQALFTDKKTGKIMEQRNFSKDITIDDIDINESRELLMEAIAKKDYLDHAGPLSTGTVATDRFSYHRIYDFLGIPSNIALAILMKDQMCMADNPQKGFIKAVGTYIVASLALDLVYFVGRRHLINQ